MEIWQIIELYYYLGKFNHRFRMLKYDHRSVFLSTGHRELVHVSLGYVDVSTYFYSFVNRSMLPRNLYNVPP